MSLRASKEAMSSASPAALIEQQETASSDVEEIVSSASPATLIGQEQTAGPSSVVERTTSSASPATLFDQQQTAGPSSTVEDQLRSQIDGLEDEVRQLKLNQDPNREAVKHTLLQDELVQLREKNLNLRVDLQVAQEKHRLLEEKYQKLHTLESEHQRCKKLMQKAIENLSSGLDISNGKSANLGLTTEGVTPGASLSSRRSVSSPPVEKAGGTPSAFQIGRETHFSDFLARNTSGGSAVQANVFGQPPKRSSTAQPLVFPPSPFQTNQSHPAKSPFAGLVSGSAPSLFRPLAATPSPAIRTGVDIFGRPQINEQAPSMFGDPRQTTQSEGRSEHTVFVNTPGFYNKQEQSFEEARLRRYECYDGKEMPSLTSSWPKTFGKSRASAPRPFYDGASKSGGFFQWNKKENIGEEGGGCVGQTSDSMNTVGANSWGFCKSAKPEGDGTANAVPISSDTGSVKRPSNANILALVDDAVETEAESGKNSI